MQILAGIGLAVAVPIIAVGAFLIGIFTPSWDVLNILTSAFAK